MEQYTQLDAKTIKVGGKRLGDDEAKSQSDLITAETSRRRSGIDKDIEIWDGKGSEASKGFLSCERTDQQVGGVNEPKFSIGYKQAEAESEELLGSHKGSEEGEEEESSRGALSWGLIRQ